MECFCTKLRKTKSTLKSQIKFKKYLIPRPTFSNCFYEILNLNSRTENEGFRLLILLMMVYTGDTEYEWLEPD